MSKYYLMAIFSILFSSITQANMPTLEIKEAMTLKINSSINPATYNYLKSGFSKANSLQKDMILIKMNTPGGLVSTTKEILTLIGESEIPVMIWVGPEGASATSAGAIIASAAHILTMSSGTNIGAATPISIQGDIKESDAKSKAINDLVALVQSLAETRGRNGKLFGEMVAKASSFKAQEAKEKKLIDGIVERSKDIEHFINDRTIVIKGTQYKIHSHKLSQESFHMDLGQKLLNIFANPSLAYILFLIGAALIYLEMQAPGGYIAGSIGVVALLMAGIGFQVLPLNFGAFGLIILSFILFVIEIYITSYGLISLAGVASLIFGSLFLFRTNDAYLELSRSVIASSVGGIICFLVFITIFFIRDHRRKKPQSFFNLIGKDACIMELIEKREDCFLYHVKVQGEIWKAKSPVEMAIGEHRQIKDQDEMMLKL